MTLQCPNVDVDVPAHCDNSQIFDLVATLTLTLQSSKLNQFVYRPRPSKPNRFVCSLNYIIN